mgnify:CR=1 FL=1|tara:strand:+ start:8239 stop:8643 length:405 start_codon:yes stop_codon:yes gene_type:complete
MNDILVGMISGQIIAIIFSSHIIFLLIQQNSFSFMKKIISKMHLYLLIFITIGSFFFWNLFSVIWVFITSSSIYNDDYFSYNTIISLIIIFGMIFCVSYIFIRKFLLHILFETLVFIIVFAVLTPFMIRRIEMI